MPLCQNILFHQKTIIHSHLADFDSLQSLLLPIWHHCCHQVWQVKYDCWCWNVTTSYRSHTKVELSDSMNRRHSGWLGRTGVSLGRDVERNRVRHRCRTPAASESRSLYFGFWSTCLSRWKERYCILKRGFPFGSGFFFKFCVFDFLFGFVAHRPKT